MMERVQKIIANAGLTSRRKAEDLIKEGKVKVNGKVIGIGDKADIGKDEISVAGKLIAKQRKVYLAFYKPGDCLTTLDDPRGRKTIFSYLRLKDRVIPVGRLDFKTEGLLFLTNDGEFANKVMHPRYEVEKSYVVYLDKAFSQDSITMIKQGVDIRDEVSIFKSRPAKVRFPGPRKDIIEVTIHEGQNRIVRRIMESLGYSVKRLIRVKIGNVSLGDLQPGKYRPLSYQEVMQFLK